MSTEREDGDGLGLPVLEDLEIFLLQIADEVPLLVGDDDVDLDVVDLDLEGRLLRRCGGGSGAAAVLAGASAPCRSRNTTSADRTAKLCCVTFMG